MSFKCMTMFCLCIVTIITMFAFSNGALATINEDFEINCEGNCSSCYRLLVTELLKDDRNFFAMQTTFFPPDDSSPVFVEVTYKYSNLNESYNRDFFWTSAVYFFFHPVKIFQFTSLLFSDPSLRYGTIDLYLPEECYDASNDSMVLLTQRVSLHAS